MRRTLLLLTFATLASARLSAQSPAAPIGMAGTLSPDTSSRVGMRALRAPKSPNTALALSLATTAASYAMLVEAYRRSSDRNGALTIVGVTGLLAGPMTGYIYGHSGAWVSGLIVRTVGAGTIVTAALLSAPCLFSSSGCEAQSALGLIGAATIVVSDIVDIVHVKRAVRAANVRARTLTFAPTWRGGPNGGPGLEARIAFGDSSSH